LQQTETYLLFTVYFSTPHPNSNPVKRGREYPAPWGGVFPVEQNRLTLLAPDIITAILSGTQPKNLFLLDFAQAISVSVGGAEGKVGD